jgi:hypothetical protein
MLSINRALDLDSKEDLIFWNSKEDARKVNEYIQDEEDQYDENHNLKGSIACYKIQIFFHNEPYIMLLFHL